MPEPIDRAKVLEYLTPRIHAVTLYGEGYNKALEDSAALVALMPTIKPEVRHGRWIKIEPSGTQFRWKCSECGGIVHAVFDFCPYCGVKMDGKDINVITKDGGADNG